MLWKQDPCCRSDLVVVILAYDLAGNQQGRLLILVIFCLPGGPRWLSIPSSFPKGTKTHAEGQNA